jgi:hypothetical protein
MASLACNAAMIKVLEGEDYPAAERELCWALAVASRTGDRDFIRETLNGLAAIASQTGDVDLAATFAAAAEALYDHQRSPLDELIRRQFLASLPDAALAGCDHITGAKLTSARIDGLIAEITARAGPVEPFAGGHRPQARDRVVVELHPHDQRPSGLAAGTRVNPTRRA